MSSLGVVIERQYSGPGARYERSASIIVGGDAGHAGITDPILTEPIDFDAEIANRRETHEPMPPVDGGLSNTVFGI